jgi:hypothetical protein
MEFPNDPTSTRASLFQLPDPLGRVGEVAGVVEGVLYLEQPPSSPGRRCTSTAVRQPDTDAAGHAAVTAPSFVSVQSSSRR